MTRELDDEFITEQVKDVIEELLEFDNFMDPVYDRMLTDTHEDLVQFGIIGGRILAEMKEFLRGLE